MLTKNLVHRMVALYSHDIHSSLPSKKVLKYYAIFKEGKFTLLFLFHEYLLRFFFLFKVSLILFVSLMLTGCTYSITMVHTDGDARDVVDETATNTPSTSVTLPKYFN